MSAPKTKRKAKAKKTKPFECWGVVDGRRKFYATNDEAVAKDDAERWNKTLPHEGPHRVVLMREVRR